MKEVFNIQESQYNISEFKKLAYHNYEKVFLTLSSVNGFFDTNKTLYFLFCLYSLVRGVKNKPSLDFMRNFILTQVKTANRAFYLKRLIELTIHQLV